MTKAACILALMCGITASAAAQSGTYTWEVSHDGLTWQSSVVAPSGSIVHVRLQASWTGVTGFGVGYAAGMFDATLRGLFDPTRISQIRRPSPFEFAGQNLSASTYTQGSKIDTSADPFEPGAGAGWINPGQAPADFGGFNSFNPCTIFTYDVEVPDNFIECGMVLNPATGRAMSIYTMSGGNQIRFNAPSVMVRNAVIIPGPASAAIFVATALTIGRRGNARRKV